VTCRFVCDTPVFVTDVTVSTHLYHIAREALNNAIKHGRASELVIKLSASGDQGELSIADDGVGLPEVQKGSGMGLNIMNYRARMVGGSLDVQRNAEGGVTVSCDFPLPPLSN
jgi:signal transduction histidine kinase